MSKEINISSNSTPIKIDVFSKDKSCNINLNNDLTLYYSNLAKQWAISDSLVDNEDYSAKYYAKNIKQNVENIISDAKNEIDDEILAAKEQVSIAENQVELAKQQVLLVETKGSQQVELAKEQVELAKQQVLLAETKGSQQVELAKEQVILANTAVNEAQEIADSIKGNFANINLSNINTEGKSVIKNLANEVSRGLPIGSIIPLFCSDTYAPEGLLPCDGAEYTKNQFSQFYTEYLVENRIITCTYEEYSIEIDKFGKCGKFGLDTVNGKFKVPKISDGTFIQSAMSVEELGKSYNAGLPNIEGKLGSNEVNSIFWTANAVGATGCFYPTGDNKAFANINGTGSIKSQAGFDASLSNNIYGNSDTVQPNAVALRFFVVVATGSINQAEMDWSEWASNLEGKLNADHSNDTKPYITETYENGNSGYITYSNGLHEEWGFSSGDDWRTVSFLKQYKDTNYNIVLTGQTSIRDGNSGTCQVNTTNKTVSSMSVSGWGLNTVNGGIYWKTIGYIM